MDIQSRSQRITNQPWLCVGLGKEWMNVSKLHYLGWHLVPLDRSDSSPPVPKHRPTSRRRYRTGLWSERVSDAYYQSGEGTYINSLIYDLGFLSGFNLNINPRTGKSYEQGIVNGMLAQMRRNKGWGGKALKACVILGSLHLVDLIYIKKIVHMINES